MLTNILGGYMARKRVMLSIDEDLDKRWKAVSKKIKMSKSAMVADFLNEVVPILEKEAPRDVMAHVLGYILKKDSCENIS